MTFYLRPCHLLAFAGVVITRIDNNLVLIFGIQRVVESCYMPRNEYYWGSLYPRQTVMTGISLITSAKL